MVEEYKSLSTVLQDTILFRYLLLELPMFIYQLLPLSGNIELKIVLSQGQINTFIFIGNKVKVNPKRPYRGRNEAQNSECHQTSTYKCSQQNYNEHS